jgi:hypothetical protein
MSNKETKYMNTTPGFVIGLENILDYIVENEDYIAQIGNIKICYKGIKEDTIGRTRQVFEIERKI